jgi:hypothetical protein
MGPRSSERGNLLKTSPMLGDEIELQWGRAQVSAEMGPLQALNFQRPLGCFASAPLLRPDASHRSLFPSRKTQHRQAFIASERKPGFRRHLAARVP